MEVAGKSKSDKIEEEIRELRAELSLRGKTAPQANSLADSVKELQEQVKELRSVVSDLRTESEHYRSETLALREELRSAVAQMPKAAPTAETTVAAGTAAAQADQGSRVHLRRHKNPS